MQRRQRARLAVERLEGRDLLSAIDAPLPTPPDEAQIQPVAPEDIFDPDQRFILTLPPPPPSDVTIEVVDGVLFIRGGDLDDTVRIVQRGDGSYAVTAWPLYNRLAPPSVCGDRSVLYSGVTGGIVIDLGAGDDSITVVGSVPTLRIDVGAGDDGISLGGWSSDFWGPCMWLNSIPFPVEATINGDLTIDGGDGADVLMPHAHVRGNAVIQLGAGDDQIVEEVDSWYDQTISTPLVVDRAKIIDLGPDEGDSPSPPPELPVYTVRLPGTEQNKIMSAKGRVPEVLTMAGLLIPAPPLGPLLVFNDAPQSAEPIALGDILGQLIVPSHKRREFAPGISQGDNADGSPEID